MCVSLSMLANFRLQFLLDCRGRCLKLFVSTVDRSSHEFASQFSLAFFVYAKSTQKGNHAPRASVYLNEPATGYDCSPATRRKGAVTAAWLVVSDPSNSDNTNGINCSHSGDRLIQIGEKATSQNGDNGSLYRHGLTIWAYELLHSPCVCSV